MAEQILKFANEKELQKAGFISVKAFAKKSPNKITGAKSISTRRARVLMKANPDSIRVILDDQLVLVIPKGTRVHREDGSGRPKKKIV